MQFCLIKYILCDRNCMKYNSVWQSFCENERLQLLLSYSLVSESTEYYSNQITKINY